jgi:hypothetical protein
MIRHAATIAEADAVCVPVDTRQKLRIESRVALLDALREVEAITTSEDLATNSQADAPDEHTPLGPPGVAGLGIAGEAATADAAFHATGGRIRDLPITLDKLP